MTRHFTPETENVVLLEFVTIFLFFYFDNKTEFLVNIYLQVECHLKQRK